MQSNVRVILPVRVLVHGTFLKCWETIGASLLSGVGCGAVGARESCMNNAQVEDAFRTNYAAVVPASCPSNHYSAGAAMSGPHSDHAAHIMLLTSLHCSYV